MRLLPSIVSVQYIWPQSFVRVKGRLFFECFSYFYYYYHYLLLCIFWPNSDPLNLVVVSQTQLQPHPQLFLILNPTLTLPNPTSNPNPNSIPNSNLAPALPNCNSSQPFPVPALPQHWDCDQLCAAVAFSPQVNSLSRRNIWRYVTSLPARRQRWSLRPHYVVTVESDFIQMIHCGQAAGYCLAVKL